MDWFKVDKNGLRALNEGKPKGHVLRELASNAFDEDAKNVEILLTQENGRGEINVKDDSPEGFRDLAEAFTLYAPSVKKSKSDKRGRFNIGEKLVIALCDEVEIISTKGGIRFDERGRHVLRKKLDRGTVFKGTFRMNKEEYGEAMQAFRQLIPPPGVRLLINGEQLAERIPFRTFEIALPTVLADDEGVMRPTRRITKVSLYEAIEGEIASVYEMGIPVVETGDRWHCDIGQKVPLNADRDNVTPAYLRELRTVVLNTTHADLTMADVTESWVREGSSDPRASVDAINTVVDKKYGQNRVSRDLSDAEANSLAFSKGYVVVEGGSHSSGEWANFRRAGAILPAGKVTPSPKPYSDDPDAEMEQLVAPTLKMDIVGKYASDLAAHLIDATISVRFVLAGKNFAACFGNRTLTFNVEVLGDRWFSQIDEHTDELLIHEFAHHYASDHLSEKYHKALCRLGAKLKRLALDEPSFFSAH